jgi:putative membrane protein
LKPFVPLAALVFLVSVLAMVLLFRAVDHGPRRSASRFDSLSRTLPEQASQPLADAVFVRSVVTGDLRATELSKRALERSSTREIKTFAQAAIDESTARAAELKKVAERVQGLRIPSELRQGQRQQRSDIEELPPDQFDKRYRAAMIRIAQQAAGEVQAYAQGGDNPDLKTWAQSALPRLRDQLQRAEALPAGFRGGGGFLRRALAPRFLMPH